MKNVFIALVVTLVGCSSLDAEQMVTQGLCTIEDQQAGLCLTAEDRNAIGAAVSAQEAEQNFSIENATATCSSTAPESGMSVTTCTVTGLRLFPWIVVPIYCDVVITIIDGGHILTDVSCHF